jgi:hypothetical protein
MKPTSKDLVERLEEKWEQLRGTMGQGEWQHLVSDLAALRDRSRTAVSTLEPERALKEVERICRERGAVRQLFPVLTRGFGEAVRRLIPVRTRGFGSGSKVAHQENRPEHVILLNRVFALVDKASSQAQPKPPEPAQEKTTPREGA